MPKKDIELVTTPGAVCIFHCGNTGCPNWLPRLFPLTQVIGIGRACGNIIAASSNFLLSRKFSAIDDLYGKNKSASARDLITPSLFSPCSIFGLQKPIGAYHPYPVSPRPCMKINLSAYPNHSRLQRLAHDLGNPHS